MRVREVILLRQAGDDLNEGRRFYDTVETGVGDYFFDSLISDIESLRLYAGIHGKRFGLYRMFATRFPFAIYYDLRDGKAIVVAALDMRRDPDWIRKRLTGKHY